MYNQQCETKYEQECETKYERQCEDFSETVCQVNRNDNHQRLGHNDDHCHPQGSSLPNEPGNNIPTPSCKEVPRQECVNKPKRECKMVPKQVHMSKKAQLFDFRTNSNVPTYVEIHVRFCCISSTQPCLSVFDRFSVSRPSI